MSSVTRFLRQIPSSAGLLGNVDSVTSMALDFVPTSGNYVGNYPPGYVVPADQTGLSSAIEDAMNGSGTAIVRDMGKTIFCPYSTTVGGSPTYAGWYRQYQLLMVNAIGLSNGFIGGLTGTNFGVVGPAPATVPGSSTYVTFYVPTAVAGILGPGTSLFNYESQHYNAGGQL